MRQRFLPEITMLVAGLITCIIAVVKQFQTFYALRTLLLVMIGFYIIGSIARFILNKVFFKEESDEEILDTMNEEEQTDEGNPEGKIGVDRNNK